MTVHLLGIRHHGPGSARSVLSALDELRPTIVLVESPAETTAAFRWIGDEGLVPPVALLGHVVDQPHRAVFAPLASFSPEWQAVQWANQHGVPVEAIDLPLAHSLAAGADDDGLIVGDAPLDPLGALAAAAGEPDAERWWDDVIEHRGEGLPAFAAVAEAMAAVREGSVPSRSEERREAHMRRAIRAALKAGHEHVVVVCGAWHVPALDLATHPASADAATLRGLPKVKVAVSWVPWTHERLASSTGYGAGVRSPGWYDHVFRHPGTDGVARFFVDAARVLRAADLPASPDHLIAATRMAEALATMRARPRPGLDEVLDAADAVMGGLPLVRRRLVVGTSIGTVPDGAPQVPLARDLAQRQRAARLKPEADAQVVELDLRTPNGLRRSHLLHQLTAIGVPWGSLEDGRGSSGTFRETWRLVWRPEWSVRLVEFAGHGTTVEQAATNRLTERARDAAGLVEVASALDLALLAALADALDPSGTFRETWRLVWRPEWSVRLVEFAGHGTTVEQAATNRLAERARDAAGLVEVASALDLALLAALADALDPIVHVLATRAANDPDIVQLMAALGPLAHASRYGDVRSTDVSAIGAVFDGLVVRVLAGLLPACASLDDEAAAAMIEHISATQQALALVDHPARRRAYPEVLEQLTEQAGHGRVHGRATRVLHDSGWWNAARVEARLGRALSPGTPPAVGAAFVEGFLAGSGTVLVHDADLRAVVDRWLSSLTPQAFEETVPLLRRTFGAFEAAERRQLGVLVAGGARPTTPVFGADVDPRRLAAAMVTVRHMLGLPITEQPVSRSVSGTLRDGEPT